nr:AsmA family protein [Phyllobacterium sp. 21LDTY02-6]
MFVFIGGLLVVLLTAALVVPYFVDWAGYRSAFEREASALLGRPVTVAGTANARLLPFPSVTFSDVRVGEPGSEPLMTIEKFSMDAELAPFLRGEVLIFDMRVEKPSAVVRIDEEGRFDWTIRPSSPFGSAQVKLENMRITDGAVIIRDQSTSTTRTISNVDATLSATDLSGPWKFGGTLFFNGRKLSMTASTGQAKPDGSMQLRTRVVPDDMPVTVETDGQLVLENQGLKYGGTINLRSADAAPTPAAATAPAAVTSRTPAEPPLLASVRVNGRFEADHAKISIPEFQMEQGKADDPYRITGNALFDYGRDPRFEIKADGQQVTFGNGTEENTTPRPQVLSERLSVFRRLMDQLPVPTVPGKIDLNLPAIVAGDTTIRSVTVDAAPSGGNWLINQLRAELPGRTQFEAKGTLQVGQNFGFDGDLLIASRQPSGLAAWLTDSVDEAIRRLAGAGLSGKVSLHEDLQKVDNLEVALGGASLKGSLVRSAKGASMPLTQLKLEGGALDADALRAFSSLFGSGDRPQLQGQDLDVSLKIGPVAAEGLKAESLDTAFRVREGAFDIDRLTISNVAGATITATGRVEPFKAEPSGSIDATILSDDLAPLLSTLGQRFPSFPFLQTLNRHSARFPGLFSDTQLSLLANTLKGDSGREEFSFSAAGNSGGMTLNFSGTAATAANQPRTLELTMNGRSGQAENLMALLGLPALPLGLAGELEADLALKGDEKSGLQTQVSLKGPGGRALVDGSFRQTGDAMSGEGRASVKVDDIDPYLATTGYSLPGFGNGTPVDLASSFQLANGKLTLPDLSGQVNDGKVTARLSASIDQGVPNIEGSAKLATLDLDSMAQFILGIGTTAGGSEEEWPRQAFAAGALFPANLNVALAIDEADAGALGPIRNFAATAFVKDGSLRFENTNGELFGGKLTGMFELRNTSGTGLATAQFTLDQAALDHLYRRNNPPVKGQARLSASINATGQTLAELMGSVAGSGAVTINDLTINAINPAALQPILADIDGIEGPVTPDAVEATINKHLHAGVLTVPQTEIAYTIAGGIARTSSFQLKGDGASLTGDLRVNLDDMSVASKGKISFDPGKSVVVGADPEVEFALLGPWGDAAANLNRQPLEQFLTQRALEREQQRVETLQASLMEKQRLRREVQLFQFRADERVRLAEEARLKVEREAAERKEAERKAAEEAARRAQQQSNPAAPAQGERSTGGAIDQRSVEEFLKSLEPAP